MQKKRIRTIGEARIFCSKCEKLSTFIVWRTATGEYLAQCQHLVIEHREATSRLNGGSITRWTMKQACAFKIEEPTRLAAAVARARQHPILPRPLPIRFDDFSMSVDEVPF